VIERVTGRRLGDALRALVLEPLGMRDTGFLIPAAAAERIATSLPSDRLWLDFAARYPGQGEAPQALQSGGGGLVSTIADYTRFARLLVNGGELEGTRLLRAETLALMCRDALGPGIEGPANLTGPGFGFGLGLAVRHDWGGAAYPTVAGEVTWSGICGPVMFAHPRERWIALSFSCNMRTRMLARMNFRHAAQAVLAG
jgi:CubicO group peptidase (beta-lactamase class C family)